MSQFSLALSNPNKSLLQTKQEGIDLRVHCPAVRPYIEASEKYSKYPYTKHTTQKSSWVKCPTSYRSTGWTRRFRLCCLSTQVSQWYHVSFTTTIRKRPRFCGPNHPNSPSPFGRHMTTSLTGIPSIPLFAGTRFFHWAGMIPFHKTLFASNGIEGEVGRN